MRVQPDHWSLLLDFAEKHPEIITNRFRGPNGRTQFGSLWKTLCCMLNALGYGEKTENDWKKAGAIRAHMKGTGGGDPIHLTLSANEDRLLKLMGKTAIDGDVGVHEVGLRKRILQDMTESGPSTSKVIVKLQKSGSSGTTPSEIAISLSKMVPITAENANENFISLKKYIISQPEPSKCEKNTQAHTTIKKSDLHNSFKEMHTELLSSLNSINKNLNNINTNFEKLVNLLENKM